MTDNNPYYTPPNYWQFNEVCSRYWQLTRSFKVKQPLLLDYSYGCHLNNLKHALWDISEAVKSNDKAAIEISMQFVLADVYFHYSGYIRATMARRLKNIIVSETSKERLRYGVFQIFMSGVFGPEYKEFVRMLQKFGLGSMENDYNRLINAGGKQRFIAKQLNLEY